MKRWLLLLALLPTCVQAQYKCLAPDGVTEYRSTPCPGTPERKAFDARRAAERAAPQPPAPPNYWQREAARLERKEAAEKAEQQAWEQRQADLERARISAAAEVHAARIAAERKAAQEAAANRPTFCTGTTLNLGSGLAVNRQICN